MEGVADSEAILRTAPPPGAPLPGNVARCLLATCICHSIDQYRCLLLAIVYVAGIKKCRIGTFR